MRGIRVFAVVGLAVALVIGLPMPMLANTINQHPTGETVSLCKGFWTMEITWIIHNHDQDNATIDWRAVPFRVVGVKAWEQRKTSATSYKSCPQRNGEVDWITANGKMTFPAPTEYFGWVILNGIRDLFSLLQNTNGNPVTKSVLFGATVTKDTHPPTSTDSSQALVTYTSRARPVNSSDPAGMWKYEYTVTNHTDKDIIFKVLVFNSLQQVQVFSGEVPSRNSVQKEFPSSPPCGVGPGAIFLNTGEVFPAASFVPSLCPTGVPTLTQWGLLALGLLLAGSLAFMIRRRLAPRPAGT